jgi:hypothetical protein
MNELASVDELFSADAWEGNVLGLAIVLGLLVTTIGVITGSMCGYVNHFKRVGKQARRRSSRHLHRPNLLADLYLDLEYSELLVRAASPQISPEHYATSSGYARGLVATTYQRVSSARVVRRAAAVTWHPVILDDSFQTSQIIR